MNKDEHEAQRAVGTLNPHNVTITIVVKVPMIINYQVLAANEADAIEKMNDIINITPKDYFLRQLQEGLRTQNTLMVSSHIWDTEIDEKMSFKMKARRIDEPKCASGSGNCSDT